MRRSMRPRSQPVGPAAPTAPTTSLKARRLSHMRASLTITRKLARRSFHVCASSGPGARGPARTPRLRRRWHRCGTGAARASVTPSSAFAESIRYAVVNES